MTSGNLRPASRGADRARLSAAVVAVVAAAAIAFLQDGADGRTFVVNVSNALGFAALALIILQVVVPAGPRVMPGPFRRTALLRLHGPFGYAALAAAVAHVLLLVADDTDNLSLLDPFDAPGRARAGLTALVALAALAVTAQRRRRGRQSRRWRLGHLALSVVAAELAVGHIAGVREYLGLDVVTGTALTLVPLAVIVALFVWPERSRG